MANTIIALATPPVPSALAVIRISGSLSHHICRQLSGQDAVPGQITYRNLHHHDELLDDVVMLSWKAPASFTGEDMMEISCHGNPLIADRIITACCELGAEPAPPGEFTRRSFMNGKMDLTQAEAVSDLIEARSERALKAVRQFQQGAFGRKLAELREELLQILSHLEAYIDFPDEDIDPDVNEEMGTRVQQLIAQLDHYLSTAKTGKFLRKGAVIVLAGTPNAGKSSLMNALLEEERVLVSDQPGTTRDTVDAECQIEGVPCFLTDTAGLRDSAEAIEKMGIERTRKLLTEADIVLHLMDGSSTEAVQELDNADPAIPKIRIVTKCDLDYPRGTDALHVSVKTGEGLPELKQAILNELKLNDQSALGESLAINTRHEFHLNEARSHLIRATENLNVTAAPEMTSSDLRGALFSLAEIVGETSNEDILDRLFQNFCIGK